MKKFKRLMDIVVYVALIASAVLTIEEAVSVGYVGIQPSILSKWALGLLATSGAAMFINGLVETLDEACIIIKDVLESFMK